MTVFKVGDKVRHKLIRHKSWQNEMLVVRVDPKDPYPISCRRMPDDRNFILEQFVEGELELVPEER
ncbi:unnamed protein product [marine sediment metagenome]|uniref:Uncharacterized protein n=1 Tax=marine sediment metagenome TaxID=412755 RepID=X1L9X2_9ZZZZ